MSRLALFALMLAACSGGNDTGGSPGNEGDACDAGQPCRVGLTCRGGTCQRGAAGDTCNVTADCGPDLYCNDQRICAPAGTLGEGAPCGSTAECLMGLVCARTRTGARECMTAGARGLGELCLRLEQCVAGLLCTDSACAYPAVDGGTDSGTPDSGPARRCVAGGAPCDDMSPCTTDQCVGDTCAFTLLDSDNDGYASSAHGPCGRDCADGDPNANPDQTGFFFTRHGGYLVLSPRTFDWNCDGTEEPRYPDRMPTCNAIDGSCTAGEGWVGMVPACGTTGTWSRCTGPGAGCRVEVVEAGRQQTCR